MLDNDFFGHEVSLLYCILKHKIKEIWSMEIACKSYSTSE